MDRSWDTSMSQKSRFKMQTQGNFNYRWTFPQLPWGTVKNPTYIQTAHGYYHFIVINAPRIRPDSATRSNRLLTNGWWQFSRKPVRSPTTTNPGADDSYEIPGA